MCRSESTKMGVCNGSSRGSSKWFVGCMPPQRSKQKKPTQNLPDRLTLYDSSAPQTLAPPAYAGGSPTTHLLMQEARLRTLTSRGSGRSPDDRYQRWTVPGL